MFVPRPLPERASRVCGSSLPPVSEAEVDARLADIARLGAQDYLEIGVPMFLVAEDLTGEAVARTPADNR
jgi:hypothetical protein